MINTIHAYYDARLKALEDEERRIKREKAKLYAQCFPRFIVCWKHLTPEYALICCSDCLKDKQPNRGDK